MVYTNSRKIMNLNKWHFFPINYLDYINKLKGIQSLKQNENNFLLSYCRVVYTCVKRCHLVCL